MGGHNRDATGRCPVFEQVAKIGAGVPLQMRGLTANQLREVVDCVLSRSSFKKAAAAIGESFRKTEGYQQAVHEIFEFKSHFQI
ncbi:hypothetical protein [Paenibacillus sp. GCM10012303]|uniref:hypothetical protein n=1 Tax=Paenibacillus sp. GCM10012303 TaxID=3317340 RepID=UPI003608CCE8